MNNIILQGVTVSDLLTQIDTLIQERIKEQTAALRKDEVLDKEYLTGKEVDKFLSIAPTTRYEWEKKGLFNRYRVSSRTRYKTSEILEALEKVESKRKY